jgi:flavorubredoxin
MTRIDEIATGIYRISTPIPPFPGLPGGFTFNQFLIVDDEPMMFHLGMAKLFPAVRDAVASVVPVDKLRWLAYSHFEPDECGAMDAWLAAAPHARPVCSTIGGMITGMTWDRETRALADGETLVLGEKRVRWHDVPHVPHGWDSGLVSELTTRTLFCGDILTQPGHEPPAVTEHDVIGPSEQMRGAVDYFSNIATAVATLERLAATEPALLACMHGSSYRGDGARVLRELGATLTTSRSAAARS